jgi:hypothetical protein
VRERERWEKAGGALFVWLEELVRVGAIWFYEILKLCEGVVRVCGGRLVLNTYR